MISSDILLSVALVILGIWNWRLLTKVNDLQQQNDTYNELILQMAQELSDLGSPNVKVFKQ